MQAQSFFMPMQQSGTEATSSLAPFLLHTKIKSFCFGKILKKEWGNQNSEGSPLTLP